MQTHSFGLYGIALLAACLLFSSCNQAPKFEDHPQLTAGVVMRDVTFFSPSMGRNMPYRVILPRTITPGAKLPAVYVLHGGGGDYRQWSNASDIARYAERQIVLVMPDAGYSYYTNSVAHPADRYEDYVVKDLVRDVETRFPVAGDRPHRAVIGISMGGFGAVKMALRHPDLFAFAGGLSSAIDVPSRPFSLRHFGQWREYRTIFGPWNGDFQHQNDPFVLARNANVSQVPYLYLSCGTQDPLLAPNRQFASLLSARSFAFEFHQVPGGHDFSRWNADLPGLFASLEQHLAKPAAP